MDNSERAIHTIRTRMEDVMLNVHRRLIAASADRIRPWIENAWTGGDGDIFPRDAIRSWRKNPQGVDPLALIPGVTRVGHGMFSFRFESWDGTFWRVRVESAQYCGWHGFDLRPIGEQCELTHTLDAELRGSARVVWPAFIAPIHDWCVEAMFDRLETALHTGAVPETSDRPMPPRAKLALAALRTLARPRSRQSSFTADASTRSPTSGAAHVDSLRKHA